MEAPHLNIHRPSHHQLKIIFIEIVVKLLLLICKLLYIKIKNTPKYVVFQPMSLYGRLGYPTKRKQNTKMHGQ